VSDQPYPQDFTCAPGLAFCNLINILLVVFGPSQALPPSPTQLQVRAALNAVLITIVQSISTVLGTDFQKDLKICPKILLRCVLSSSYDIDLRSANIILRFS